MGEKEEERAGNRRRKTRTRKRKSTQTLIVAEHIMPGKMSSAEPRKTLPKVETKTLGRIENEYRMTSSSQLSCFQPAVLYH